MKQLFALSMLLVACGGAPQPSESLPPPAPIFVVEGKVVGFNPVPALVQYFSGHQTLLKLDSPTQRSIEFILPRSEEALAFAVQRPRIFDTDCPGTVTLSDPQAVVSVLGRALSIDEAYHVKFTSGYFYAVEVDQTNFKQRLWLYADRSTTVTGTETCTSPDKTATESTYRLNLVAGWNHVVLEGNLAGTFRHYRTEPVTQSTWVWVKGPVPTYDQGTLN